MASKKNIVIKVKYPTPRHQDKENAATAKMITEWNVKRIAIALGIIVLIISFSIYFGFSEPESSKMPSKLSGQAGSPESNQLPVSAPDKGAEVNTESLPAAHSEEPDQPAQFRLSEADKVISSQVINELKENIGSEQADNEDKDTVKEQPVTVIKKSPGKVKRNVKVIRALLASKIVNKEPVHILNSPVYVTKTKSVWINYFTEFKGMNKKTVYHEWINKDRIVYRQRINISADRWRAASRKVFNRTSKGPWQARTVDEKGRLLDQQEFQIILNR